MSRVRSYLFFCLVIVPVVLFFRPFVGHPVDIDDMRILKQDHMAYVHKTSFDQEMVQRHEQAIMDEFYNRRFFSVWHQRTPRHSLEEIFGEFDKYAKTPGYEQNKKKRHRASIEKLKTNAGLESYPNMGFPAMTINSSNLRILPTRNPHYASMRSSSNLSQFDSFQVSSIGVNVPVFISHMTKDKAWLLAETDYYFGWIAAEDVAYVDETVINAWETGQYVAVIKDRSSVMDESGQQLFHVSLGTIFPSIGTTQDHINILAAVEGSHKRIRLKRAFVSKAHAAQKPLKMTTFNIARLANEMINEPYGWGGIDGKRDCSLMIRDLFAPFGIWLHRNSNEQGQHGGIYINLATLSDADKRKKILTEGIPYATLIWKKGHIMLYIGSYQNEPVIFHNIWSVRQVSAFGRDERKIVGRAAITTLLPGKDILSRKPLQDNLLKDISGMTILIPLKRQ
jgi:hypothetical protein